MVLPRTLSFSVHVFIAWMVCLTESSQAVSFLAPSFPNGPILVTTSTEQPAHERLGRESQSTACGGGTRRRSGGVASLRRLTPT